MKQTLGHDKLFPNEKSGKQLPNLDVLEHMCRLFECEMGYLLCEYDCKTREATDIHDATGLSEKAIDTLQNIKIQVNVE